MVKIEIDVERKGKAIAELDERNQKTASKIYENLPIEGMAKIWKEEVYFEIPIEMNYENKSPRAERGDVSYWPPGKAFCIFYGESQPYSDVNHVGKVTENLEMFKDVKDGDKIVLRKYRS
ncbi:MAG: cyclophilin-like fold protein [Candidatus Aenigmarchaeota archaeon]|nr:cyclophilin-like fold protein [Candidatus Aenigmarchaeota archaeon]